MSIEIEGGTWNDFPKTHKEELEAEFKILSTQPWYKQLWNRRKICRLAHKIHNHETMFPEEYV